MVAQLLCHGLGVVAFDPDQGRVRLAASRGATAAASVAEVGAAARVVSVCVRDADQLDKVLQNGLLAAATPGMVVLIHSTVGPAACRLAAARLHEVGATVLDAPVSGMRMAAEAGTLTFFVGGPADALATVQGGLASMGRTVVHVGDVGAGQFVKIANNLVAFGTVGLLLEMSEAARAAGVAEERLIDALGHGSARSWVVENWGFLSRDWKHSQPGGAAAVRAIIEKDLALAARTAAELGVDASFSELAARVVPAALSTER
jgi:3-hydroxyisobutyrate dehydrogenase-like beta-hydroxyacid dehydrogenase